MQRSKPSRSTKQWSESAGRTTRALCYHFVWLNEEVVFVSVNRERGAGQNSPLHLAQCRELRGHEKGGRKISAWWDDNSARPPSRTHYALCRPDGVTRYTGRCTMGFTYYRGEEI